MLPCKHEAQVVSQVRPTIELLTDLDTLYPEVLRQQSIEPADYKTSLVFRSAIESIRGSFAASSTTQREALVEGILASLRRQSRIADYDHTAGRQRYDFTIAIERDPDYFVALEVKGGEGNSINISERPLWAREFGVWCHLDGAIINQPAHGAHSIVNRLANELVRRSKKVDMVFFKDILCGTRLRPCPKYTASEQENVRIAPDIILFPQRIPSKDDPQPPVHTLDTLRLPRLILELFGVHEAFLEKHVWSVRIEIAEKAGKLIRIIEIEHQGQIVDRSRSRS